jgi:hypothetical protein
MSLKEKFIHSFIIAAVFSILCWFIVNTFIIEITFWKYIIIEIILAVSKKLYTFTLQKTHLQ